MCSYLAVLNTCDHKGESVFSIVETNPFKHLTHLSLQFFPGDDASIKAYLAARLAQVSAEKRQLASALKLTTTDLRATKQRETEMQKQLETLTQQTEATLSKEMMKFADEINAQVGLYGIIVTIPVSLTVRCDPQRESAAQTLKQREEAFTAKIDSLGNKFEEEVRHAAL